MRGKEHTKWSEVERKLIKTEIRKARLTSLHSCPPKPIHAPTREDTHFGLMKAGGLGVLQRDSGALASEWAVSLLRNRAGDVGGLRADGLCEKPEIIRGIEPSWKRIFKIFYVIESIYQNL